MTPGAFKKNSDVLRTWNKGIAKRMIMKKVFAGWVALGVWFLFAPLSVEADERDSARSIVSITICSPDPGSTVTPSCGTAYDTERPVIAPGLPTQTINQASVGTATDEHSTVFPPGYLGNNRDYLFFVASGSKNVNPDIGMMVLSSPGPDKYGQWTAQPATANGYGNYSGLSGQVFLPPLKPDWCPDLPSNNDIHFIREQDQTFDLNYAAAGTVFKDPTSESGRLLMVYEGANDCAGVDGGPKSHQNSYQTIGVATSLDGGRTWPRYASKGAFMSAELPLGNPVKGQTDNHGPQAPFGAMGQDVCTGNICPPHVPANYGRYLALSPAVSLESLMQAGKPVINGQLGHSEPSAFVDDVQSGDRRDDDRSPYVYIVTHYLSDPDGSFPPLPSLSNGRKDDLAVARAKLDRHGAPLSFSKWNGTSFPAASNGSGGPDVSMLSSVSDGNFTACGDNGSRQGRSQGSISWVEETRQYLLVFVCTSPADPAKGAPTAGETGSAWFFATADKLSDQSSWSIPKEIEGSYARHVESNQPNDIEAPPKPNNDCAIFNGWYPNLMSQNKAPGHLSTRGYVFYLIGSLGACTDNDNDGDGGLAPRTYASRQFTIVTAPH
jgi:hypothetical protein